MNLTFLDPLKEGSNVLEALDGVRVDDDEGFEGREVDA